MSLQKERKKGKKPISQLVPLCPGKQSQLKFPFNLVEHCPALEHRFGFVGQLESKIYYIILYIYT